MESLAVTYFHWKYNQLSSAQKRFTVLFGMGRSGTTSVWPPGKGFEFQDLRPDSRILFGNKAKRRAAFAHSAFHYPACRLESMSFCRLQAARL